MPTVDPIEACMSDPEMVAKHPDEKARRAACMAKGQAKPAGNPFAKMNDGANPLLYADENGFTPWVQVFRAGQYPQGAVTASETAQIAADYSAAVHDAPVCVDHKEEGPALG